MAQEILFIPKQSDKVLFSCFHKLATDNNVRSITLTALGQSEIGRVPVVGEQPPAMKKLLDQDINLIQSASLNIEGLSLNFQRGGNTNDPSPHHDTIRISYNQQGNRPILEVETRISIIATLVKDLRAFDPHRAVQGSSEEQNQLHALHQSMLERLETTATTLVENLGQHAERLQSQFEEKEAARAEEIKKHKNSLDSDQELALERVQDKERKLEARIKEIDNRDNTHVRRELRGDLIREIRNRSEKFRLTEGTNKLRRPVHAACISGMGILGLGATYFAIQLNAAIGGADTLYIAVVALKQVGLTLGIVALGFFYIRWLNRWFDQHARAEFELKQFQLDIDRASWLVETALEWKADEGQPLPDALLNSLTRNLFSHVDGVPTEHLKYPADVLASALLGTASKTQLNIGDSTLEFRGRKLKKQMEKKP